MLTFQCDSCGQALFFENSTCIRCGSWLGYSRQENRVLTLAQRSDANAPPPDNIYPALAPRGGPKGYRQCKNTTTYNACNWLIPEDSPEEYCGSCQLTEILPPLVDEDARKRWVRVETAKRRLLFTLQQLQLPIVSRKQDPDLGLAFRFPEPSDKQPVVTGHAQGVITLNIAEADHSFRENEREKLGEAYRTVLGHLRHEVGHYYWDVCVRDSEKWLPLVRQQFGDDQESYQDAISRHYAEGPPADWHTQFISAYATMHPWEDWAETFAHYLHMVDTLETAQSYDLSLTSPSVEGHAQKTAKLDALDLDDFDQIFRRWYSLTFVLNGLSRSMGMPDTYPFSISDAVRDKLRTIHDVIHDSRAYQQAQNERPAQNKQPAQKPTAAQTREQVQQHQAEEQAQQQ